MTVYLGSPNSQLQAHAARGMPVLVSWASFSPWMEQYLPTFDTLLIDSGAYSELSGRAKVDVEEYTDWARTQHCVAWAGLDDISGDWRRSLRNYEHGGFPTYHETDPPDIVDDLVALARAAGGWIGVGLLPPREGKRETVRRMLDLIPDDLHVHGWALRRYLDLPRINSVDSTNWWRDAMKLRTTLPWLSYGECLDLIVTRYKREHIIKTTEPDREPTLWD